MIIASNWKAYVEDLPRAKKLVAIAKRKSSEKKHEFIIAPSAPYLGLLAKDNKSAVSFAAQNISETTGGAKTGESTAAAFASCGATYAIVGHSERRALGETNDTVAEKLNHAFAHGLTPILCVGERTRDANGTYLSFVRDELTTAFQSRSPKEASRVIVAYEPIWAIGKTANDAMHTNDLTEMVLYIRKVLADVVPGLNASKMKILYGGSAEPANVVNLSLGTGIDGFLIGHASADPVAFSAMVSALS